MAKTEYEILHPLRRNGADYKRGSTVELEESEASPLLRGGVLRELPERASKPKGRPRKQSESNTEASANASEEPAEE